MQAKINFSPATSWRWLYSLFLFTLALLVVVFPNSFQVATLCVLLLCFVFLCFRFSLSYGVLLLLGFMCLSFLVSFVYLVVGVLNGAPGVAVIHVLFIYVFSPLFWFFVIYGALKLYGEVKIVRLFSFLAVLCVISVAVFFALFINFGPDSVSMFKENANVNVKEGYSGATMHVYGSLIFITGAFFAASDTIPKRSTRFFILLSLLVCALTSGRSALMLAAPVGLLIFFVISKGFSPKKVFHGFIIISLLSFFLIYIMGVFLERDVLRIISLFLEEMGEGGGSVRVGQSLALWDGVAVNSGIGSGHGVGVDYIRSYEFPWRYEVVWLATIYRVGFFGAFIYFLPFLIYFLLFFRRFIRGEVGSVDRFFFGGFLCVFLVSTTNPYIEAFSFQWMYILPVVLLFDKLRIGRSERNAIA